MELLILLVEHRERVVSREEIVARLWGADKFVDADNGINTAIRKLRTALRDRPGRSAFIKTISGKGYRFVATVQATGAVSEPARQDRAMLAVLPFVNLSGDPEQEYFADGMTEETICHLGQLDPQRMGVIARTSSMAYKNTVQSVAQIGLELGVDFLLESSVRRQSDIVRFTAQLIRVSDQTHLWAESYDRAVTDLMSVQNEIGRAIAKQVAARLMPEVPAMPRTQTRNADAYDLYLRGRYHWNHLTPPAINQAIGFFQQAVAQDPTYALAYAGMAEALAMLPITCDLPVSEILPKSLAAASKAVALDSSLAEGHAAMAAIKVWLEWDWLGAEAAAQKAIALNPSYRDAHRWYALMLSAVGRHHDSAAQMKLVRELDPLSALMHGLSGALMYNARRDDLALQHLHRALEINSKVWTLHLWTGKSYERLGRMDEALAEYQIAFDTSGGNTECLSSQACIHAQTGRLANAHQGLDRLLELSSERYVPPYNIAMIFAALGDDASALRWLNKAYQSKDARLVWVDTESRWDRFRSTNEFQSLLQQMQLPLEISAL